MLFISICTIVNLTKTQNKLHSSTIAKLSGLQVLGTGLDYFFSKRKNVIYLMEHIHS